MNVVTNPAPDAVKGPSGHILFVEGDSQNSIDPAVLDILFEDQPTPITIQHLGPSFHVKSAAQALASSHPHYYFLIDRDHHHQDRFIDDCWNHFPNPAKYNLLIWRKREIENYFLDPDYLALSPHLISNAEDLKEKILRFSQTRLYLDAANQVIVSIREEFKEHGINIFKNPSDFKTRDEALAKILGLPNFSDFASKAFQISGNDEIEQRFNQSLDDLTGGKAIIEYGSGRWLDLIQGKPVLSQVINVCFRVDDVDGNQLAGAEKITYVAKSLLKQAAHCQPRDFQILKRLICQRLAQG